MGMGRRKGARKDTGARAPHTPGAPVASPATGASGTPKGGEGRSSVLVRFVSGLALVVLIISVVYTGHFFVLISIIVLQVLLFYEFMNVNTGLSKRLPLYFRFFPWLLFLWAQVAWNLMDLLDTFLSRRRLLNTTMDGLVRLTEPYVGLDASPTQLIKFVYVLVQWHTFISFALACVLLVIFVLSLRNQEHYRHQFNQLSWSITAIVIIVGITHVTIKNLFTGIFWVLFPVALIAINDTAAYVCGRVFGRRQLTHLSPKKTVEGFVGALVATMAVSVVLTPLMVPYPFLTCPPNTFSECLGWKGNAFTAHAPCLRTSGPPGQLFEWISYVLPPAVQPVAVALGLGGADGAPATVGYMPLQLHALLFGFVASTLGPFGGFFASGLKRAFNIKDFGTTIPGHGGFLDRLDCMLLMMLFTHVYLELLRMPSVGHAVNELLRFPPHERAAIIDTAMAIDPIP